MNIELPVIDISSIRELDAPEYLCSSMSEDCKLTINKIHSSLSQIGFMYIKGHGIEKSLIDQIFAVSKKFFTLEAQEKMKISMKASKKQWRGYFPLGDELTSGRPDQKEGIYLGEEHGLDHEGVINDWFLHGSNQWPESLPEMKDLVLSYMKKLKSLAILLMKSISVGLGLHPNYFLERGFINNPTILFRIFNYPKHVWEASQDEWGVREHTDYGFLTILKQDNSGGLQVKLKNGQWIDAVPIEDTFVINIGDMLELWTHSIYKATPHRVKNQGNGDRLSLPFFFDPSWNSTLQRVEKQLLRSTDLEDAASDTRIERWDGIQLDYLNESKTYGEQLLSKVSKVFPELFKGNL